MKEMSDSSLKMLADAIRLASHICVFTGAGISCPSGIPDFRSADGLYRQSSTGCYSPEEIISHSFFKQHPDLFYTFYKSKMVYPDARPNAAHLFFAALEHEKQVSVVTQNIDGLHQAAGSTCVFELHGSIHRNHCTKCGTFYPLQAITNAPGIPTCSKDNGILKPDVVLYEEALPEETVEQAIAAIGAADLMIVVGTSLSVYPAASFLQFFHGQTLALINKAETPFDNRANLIYHMDVIQAVEQLKALQK